MNLEEIHSKLDHEVTDLHFRWNIYRKLFGSGPETVALLNRYGSNFFYYTQFLMLDHLSLAFSKLTDPSSQGGRIQHENLCLRQYNTAYNILGEADLVQTLDEKFGELEAACKKFRVLRNKRIAHADLSHSLQISQEPLPGISREYIECALGKLREYMDIINLHRDGSRTAYEWTIEDPNGSVDLLLDALRKADDMA